MRIRELAPPTRLTEQIRKAGYETNKDFANEIEIPAPVLSDISNKRILPTVPLLRLICTKLNCYPLDIYSAEELDLKGCIKKIKGRRSRRIRRWRVECNIGKEMHKRLVKVLEKKGYTFQAWMMEKIVEELKKEELIVEAVND